jgi:hypothetical protein
MDTIKPIAKDLDDGIVAIQDGTREATWMK